MEEPRSADPPVGGPALAALAALAALSAILDGVSAAPPRPRHPKNAPGPFYVEDGYCLFCTAPRAEAPGLVAVDEDRGCYFRPNGRCTRPAAGDDHCATFEHTTSSDRRPAARFTLERLAPRDTFAAAPSRGSRVPPPSPSPSPSIYRSATDHPVWLLHVADDRHSCVALHSALLHLGAVAIRWLSAAECSAGADGQPLPY